MSKLSSYLAKNYLTASTPSKSDSLDSRPTKKRKKTNASTNEAVSSLSIADDDEDLLLSSKSKAGLIDEDDESPMLFNAKVRSAEFRKSKKNAWQPLPMPDDEAGIHSMSHASSAHHKANNGGGGGDEEDDNDADILLRQTIADAEIARSNLDAENAPTIVASTSDSAPRMESGAFAGIQTAADTARLIAEHEAREQQEERRARRSRKKDKKPEPEEETIYRDATGRRIDLTLRRQEAQRAEREKAAAEKKARQDAMGEVQLRQREERKQELEDAKFLALGRSADDEEMNERLKEEVRWDDPMAAYMANKRAEEHADKGGPSSANRSDEGAAKRSGDNKRREYQGAAPPNRYGIKPGWRWDGVDRGNGFENQWFQARGKKARNESLEYQWQMDE